MPRIFSIKKEFWEQQRALVVNNLNEYIDNIVNKVDDENVKESAEESILYNFFSIPGLQHLEMTLDN